MSKLENVDLEKIEEGVSISPESLVGKDLTLATPILDKGDITIPDNIRGDLKFPDLEKLSEGRLDPKQLEGLVIRDLNLDPVNKPVWCDVDEYGTSTKTR